MGQEQTVTCPICGKPYLFYPFYCGDQGVCPACYRKARKCRDWYCDDNYPYPRPPKKYFLQKI